MHVWPVTHSILLLQRGGAAPRLEMEELPENLVAATTRAIMRIGAGSNADSSRIDPWVSWLVQEALKSLPEN